MISKKHLTTILIALFMFSYSQNILPGQKNAIRSLANSAGFSSNELDNYLIQNYGKPLDQLSQNDGASIIKGLQSGSIKVSSKKPKTNNYCSNYVILFRQKP